MTRAYAAGFGTAGSMLAGAAILFVLASAIVAYQGWPRIGTQAPPSLQVTPAPAPAAPVGSLVSRRLSGARLAAPTPAALHRTAARRRPARATVPTARPVGLRTPRGHSRGRSGTAAPPTSGASAPGPRSPSRSGTAGRGDISVTTPTRPPVTITLPVGTVIGTADEVVRTVAGAIGRVPGKVRGTVGGMLSAPGRRLGP